MLEMHDWCCIEQIKLPEFLVVESLEVKNPEVCVPVTLLGSCFLWKDNVFLVIECLCYCDATLVNSRSNFFVVLRS